MLYPYLDMKQKSISYLLLIPWIAQTTSMGSSWCLKHCKSIYVQSEKQ